MFIYEKKLQFPVNISNPDPKLAKIIITQLGGPDGELAASMRYLNQRYSMPVREVKALLTDIGTEELSHLEIVSAIIYQLTRNLCIDDIKEAGFDEYFVDHTTGIYTQAASGNAFTAAYFQSKGDPITDLIGTICGSLLGTSMPMVPLPGIGAIIRMPRAARLKAISSSRRLILAILTPSAGIISYNVTVGPTVASMWDIGI